MIFRDGKGQDNRELGAVRYGDVTLPDYGQLVGIIDLVVDLSCLLRGEHYRLFDFLDLVFDLFSCLVDSIYDRIFFGIFSYGHISHVVEAGHTVHEAEVSDHGVETLFSGHAVCIAALRMAELAVSEIVAAEGIDNGPVVLDEAFVRCRIYAERSQSNYHLGTGFRAGSSHGSEPAVFILYSGEPVKSFVHCSLNVRIFAVIRRKCLYHHRGHIHIRTRIFF